MRHAIIILLLTCTFSLVAISSGDWQNIRFSEKTQSNQVFLRTEITNQTDIPSKALYHNDTSIVETDLNNYNDNTYQASVPIASSRRYIGFRKGANETQTKLNPVFYTGSTLPGLTQFSKLSVDAQNETTYNYLDIVTDHVTFSDTKIYAAIQNRGGGFPFSSNFGTVYLSYMTVMAAPTTDPSDPNATVWAMNYMNVGLAGISPGLYKITGTSTSDITRIGNIESQIVSGSNLLIMSCNLSDLLNDPDFTAWYNPQAPEMGMVSLTTRTSILSMSTTPIDNSPGGFVYPNKIFADPITNSTHAMNDFELVIEPEDVFYQAVYTNSDGLFTTLCETELLGMATYPMIEQSLDYSVPVTYRTENLIGVLPEFADMNTRIKYSAGDIQHTTPWLPLTYIGGLPAPLEPSISVSGNSLTIQWDAVTQSSAGTSLSPDRYIVSLSPYSDFSSEVMESSTNTNSISFDVDTLGNKRFIRITAIKDVP